MTRCIEQLAERQQHPASDHREMMASVAHDLRTPLTALHGHLEALSGPAARPADARLLWRPRWRQATWCAGCRNSGSSWRRCGLTTRCCTVNASAWTIWWPPRCRSSSSAPSRGGIGGLGLAIAQRVALLHGGSLLPLPAPQGGTVLCLALPLAA